MMSSSDRQVFDDRLLARYLLGILPAEEAERLDELSIADEEFAWRLTGIENDLVDAYVRGELSGDDREQFKAFYLSSPVRRRKVEFAQGLLALERRTSTAPAKANAASPGGRPELKGRPSWFGLLSLRPQLPWGFAGAAALALVAAGYLLSENVRLRKEMSEAQVQHASLDQRSHELEQQLGQERSAKAEALRELEQARASQTGIDQLRTLSLLLPPPTRGATRIPTLSLRPGTGLVVLVLSLESDDFPAYRATIKNPATNQVLWRSPSLEATSGNDNKAVSFSFRADLLKPQNYIVELAGISERGAAEDIGGYPFRVVLR